jgi:hypothetical protein
MLNGLSTSTRRTVPKSAFAHIRRAVSSVPPTGGRLGDDVGLALGLSARLYQYMVYWFYDAHSWPPAGVPRWALMPPRRSR